MTKIETITKTVIETAIEAQTLHDVDYINQDDGLLYCGYCNTPKQYRMRLLVEDRDVTVPSMCKCEMARSEAEKQRRQEEREMEIVKRLRDKSLMDERLKNHTFQNFSEDKNNSKILKLCKRYAEKFTEMEKGNQGLLFYGGYGTGKTFAAACIANYLLERKIPVVMTSFVKILEGGVGENVSELISKLDRVRLLIIDDLGAERYTEYALERVYNIIDSRYRTKKPMIITTNLDLSDMQNTGDMQRGRIYDRIFENCYPVKFEGNSFRKIGAKRRWNEMKTFLEGGDD